MSGDAAGAVVASGCIAHLMLNIDRLLIILPFHCAKIGFIIGASWSWHFPCSNQVKDRLVKCHLPIRDGVALVFSLRPFQLFLGQWGCTGTGTKYDGADNHTYRIPFYINSPCGKVCSVLLRSYAFAHHPFRKQLFRRKFSVLFQLSSKIENRNLCANCTNRMEWTDGIQSTHTHAYYQNILHIPPTTEPLHSKLNDI